MRFRRQTAALTLRLPMSPMIDIIFLLLIFFVMTFQIVPLEGDLSITAPLQAGDRVEQIEELPLDPPLHVKLTANADGGLAEIDMAGHSFATTADLARRIRDLFAGSSEPSAEAVIEADPELDYAHVIDVLTALSGYVDESGGTVKLIGKIRFSS